MATLTLEFFRCFFIHSTLEPSVGCRTKSIHVLLRFFHAEVTMTKQSISYYQYNLQDDHNQPSIERTRDLPHPPLLFYRNPNFPGRCAFERNNTLLLTNEYPSSSKATHLWAIHFDL